MPFVCAHHEVDAHAHLGVCEDELRLALEGVLAGEFQCVHQGLHVVAADFDDLPAESLVLGAQVAEAEHVVGGAVNLFLVVVDDGDEVVNAFGGGIHGGFPNLAFLLLTVAHEDEDEMFVAVQLLGLCRADGDGEALSQGT